MLDIKGLKQLQSFFEKDKLPYRTATPGQKKRWGEPQRSEERTPTSHSHLGGQKLPGSGDPSSRLFPIWAENRVVTHRTRVIWGTLCRRITWTTTKGTPMSRWVSEDFVTRVLEQVR